MFPKKTSIFFHISSRELFALYRPLFLRIYDFQRYYIYIPTRFLLWLHQKNLISKGFSLIFSHSSCDVGCCVSPQHLWTFRLLGFARHVLSKSVILCFLPVSNTFFSPLLGCFFFFFHMKAILLAIIRGGGLSPDPPTSLGTPQFITYPHLRHSIFHLEIGSPFLGLSHIFFFFVFGIFLFFRLMIVMMMVCGLHLQVFLFTVSKEVFTCWYGHLRSSSHFLKHVTASVPVSVQDLCLSYSLSLWLVMSKAVTTKCSSCLCNNTGGGVHLRTSIHSCAILLQHLFPYISYFVTLYMFIRIHFFPLISWESGISMT